MAALVLRIALSGVLLVSAALKAASPARTRAALATVTLLRPRFSHSRARILRVER